MKPRTRPGRTLCAMLVVATCAVSACGRSSDATPRADTEAPTRAGAPHTDAPRTDAARTDAARAQGQSPAAAATGSSAGSANALANDVGASSSASIASAPPASPAASDAGAPVTAAPTPTAASAGAGSAERADAELRREGRSPIVGYLLTIPPSFSSADGAFDLVVHFHGNWDIVEESFAVAQVNAVVVMVQSGNGMRSYLGSFASPRDFEGIVKRSAELLAERGLKTPHLRRIAVTSWSAGYGSIMQLIRQPEHVDRLSAIIALDGVQGRLIGGEVDPQEIAPLVAIARQAMKGERMLLLTHTAIPNAGEMGSTTASIGGLLKILGVAESPLARAIDMKPLPSTLASLPARMLTNCEQVSEGRWGDFTVRGYAGFRPEDHNAELQQIAAIALPDLKRYLEAAH